MSRDFAKENDKFRHIRINNLAAREQPEAQIRQEPDTIAAKE